MKFQSTISADATFNGKVITCMGNQDDDPSNCLDSHSRRITVEGKTHFENTTNFFQIVRAQKDLIKLKYSLLLSIEAYILNLCLQDNESSLL